MGKQKAYKNSEQFPGAGIIFAACNDGKFLANLHVFAESAWQGVEIWNLENLENVSTSKWLFWWRSGQIGTVNLKVHCQPFFALFRMVGSTWIISPNVNSSLQFWGAWAQ